jgi:hypothetical protein
METERVKKKKSNKNLELERERERERETIPSNQNWPLKSGKDKVK